MMLSVQWCYLFNDAICSMIPSVQWYHLFNVGFSFSSLIIDNRYWLILVIQAIWSKCTLRKADVELGVRLRPWWMVIKQCLNAAEDELLKMTYWRWSLEGLLKMTYWRWSLEDLLKMTSCRWPTEDDLLKMTSCPDDQTIFSWGSSPKSDSEN